MEVGKKLFTPFFISYNESHTQKRECNESSLKSEGENRKLLKMILHFFCVCVELQKTQTILYMQLKYYFPEK